MRIKKTASFNVKEGVKSVRYSDLNSGIQYLPADGIINIKSEKVRIAGFGVNESSLYKIDVNGTPYSIGSANSIYLSNAGIITSRSIGGSKGTLSWAMAISDKFGVTVDGTLYAMGGHFAGTIEAKSGKIGTTLINEDGSIVSANGGFRLDANGDITISHVGGSQLVQDTQTALSTANNAMDQANAGMNKWLVTKYNANGKGDNTITTIPLLIVNKLVPESTTEYNNLFSDYFNSVPAPRSGIIFSETQRVAYAVTYVNFSADTTVSNFALATDDGGTLYLNGKQIIHNPNYVKSNAYSVTFKKGWNVIEVVAHNGGGPGGFALATYDSSKDTYSALDLTKLSNFQRMDCYCPAFSGQTAYGLAVNAKVLETSSSLETVSRQVIYKIDVQYAQSDSNMVAPKVGWSTTAPPWEDGKYMWQQTVTTYGDGRIAVSEPTCISGAEGAPGSSVTLTGYKVQYQVGTSGTTAPTGTWSDTVVPTTTGQFLWTRIQTSFSNGNTYTSYSVSAHGQKGDTGLRGAVGPQGVPGTSVTILSTDVTYQVGGSATVPPSGVWHDDIQQTQTGQYLWTKMVTNFSDGQSITAYSVAAHGATGARGLRGIQGEKGDQGIPGNDGYSPTVTITKNEGSSVVTITDKNGPHSTTVLDGAKGTPGMKGADGKTSYFHVKYSNDGGKTLTANNGETVGDYIGTRTDFVEMDSTNVADYTWAKIKGDTGDTGPRGLQGLQGPKGDQGIQGPTGADGTSFKAFTTGYVYGQSNVDAYSAYGYSGTWDVYESTSGLKVGDTIQLRLTNASKSGHCFIIARVTAIPGDKSITCTSLGLIDKGNTGADGKSPRPNLCRYNCMSHWNDKTYSYDQATNTYTITTAGDTQEASWGSGIAISTTNKVIVPYGQRYVASAEIYSPVAAVISIDFNNAPITGTAWNGNDNDNANARWTAGTTNIPANTWTTITWSTANSRAGNTDKVDIYLNDMIGLKAPADTTWKLRNLKVELGDTATPWTPNGADLVGPQGAMGPQGPQGISSYTHIAYATSADGKSGFDVSNGSGKTYMGVYVDSNPTDSTDPTKYMWTLIKGAKGDQGVPGAKGADGRTPYFHIAYANIVQVGGENSNFTLSAQTVVRYGNEALGKWFYKDLAAGNYTASNAFFGDPAVGSVKVIQTFSDFSVTESGARTYIGQYTDYTQADSTNPASYAWTKIKGETGATGAQGPRGADGKTTYFHIKYSSVAKPTNANQMTETPSAYIGTYVDYVEADSNDPAKYTWSRFEGMQGAKGDQGVPGKNGSDGKTYYLHIAYANSANGVDGFSTTDPSGRKYLGQCTDLNSADPTTPASYSWSLIKGDKGLGVKAITPQHYLSTSNTTQVNGNWSPAEPQWIDGKYIWTRSQITWEDNSVTYSDPVLANSINSIAKDLNDLSIGGRNLAIGTADLILDTRDTVNTASGTNSEGSYIYSTKKGYSLSDSISSIKKGDVFTISYYFELYKCTSLGRFGCEPQIEGTYYHGWQNNTTISPSSTMDAPIKKTVHYVRTAVTDLNTWNGQNLLYAQGLVLSDGGYCVIKNLKIEKGNKATDWTPAPEDIESGIADANDKASQANSLANTANNTANNALNQANNAMDQANAGMNKWLVTKYNSGKTDNSITTIPLLLINKLVPESTMEYSNAFSDYFNNIPGPRSGIIFSEAQRVAYAVTYVNFNADTTVSNLVLGTDDGGTLYLNGSQIIRNGSYTISSEVSVTFKKGWNVIEVVVHNGTGPGGFVLATYDSSEKTYSALDLTKLPNFQRMDCYCSAFSGQTAYGLAVNAKVLETSSSLETVSRQVTSTNTNVTDLMTRTSQVETNVTNLKSDVDNIQVGGRNLIVLTTSRDGYRPDVSGNDFADQNNTMTDYFDVYPSCDYTMSISKDLPILESSYYELCLYDKDKKHISRVIMYGSGNFKAGREHGVTIKSQSNAVYGRVSFPINAKKYVKFELGNKASDWTPAPEDVDASIKGVADTENTHYSTLTTQYNDQQTTINGTVTRLGKAENRITTVANDLSNLSIGGRNLYLNTISYRENTPFVLTGTSTDIYIEHFDGKVIYSTTKLTKGTQVVMQAKSNLPWSQVHGGSATNKNCVGMWIYECASLDDAKIPKYITPRFMSGDNKSTYMVWKTTVTQDCYPVFRFNAYSDGTATVTAKVWDIKLELGNKATDWSPAPEDFESKISEQSNAFATYKQTIDNNLSTIGTTYQRKDDMKNYATNSSVQSAINQSKTDITNSVSSNYVKTQDYGEDKKATEKRFESAEEKITADAIVSTVKSSQDWSVLQENASKLDWQVINSSVDLNTMKTDGRYLLKGGATNTYDGCNGWQYLIVESIPDNNRVTQTMWHDDNTESRYTRKFNGSWTPWVRESNSSNAISVINQSSESVMIQANRIDINGLVTFNGGNNAIANKIKNDISNINIGGRNLIRDSKFTSTSWSGSDGINIVNTNGSHFTYTTNGIKTVKSNGWGGTGVEIHTDAVPVTYEKTVTLSFDLKIVKFDDIGFNALANTTGNQRWWARNISSTSAGIDVAKNDLNNWHRVSCTVKIPAKNSLYEKDRVVLIRLVVGQNGGDYEYYMKNLKLELGDKATDWSPAPEDFEDGIADAKKAGTNAQSTANTAATKADAAQSTANDAKKKAEDAQTRASTLEQWKTNTVDTKLNHAYDIVNRWAQDATSDTTTINGGLIQTNTITADKIAIGDFTNIFQMNKDNCGKYGFDFGSSATSGVYYVAHVQRDHHMGEFVSCKGGEQYYISADIYSSCHSNDGTWYPIGVGIHTVDVAHKNPSWVCLYAYPTNDNRRCHVEGTVTASREAGLVRAFFLILDDNHPLSNGYESDIVWISNCEIRKMNAGELIVDGAITGDKLAVNCISNSNFKDENYGTTSSWINLKRGTMNLGGKLMWDGNDLTINGNGTFTGIIKADQGRIGGWTITNDGLVAERQSFFSQDNVTISPGRLLLGKGKSYFNFDSSYKAPSINSLISLVAPVHTTVDEGAGLVSFVNNIIHEHFSNTMVVASTFPAQTHSEDLVNPTDPLHYKSGFYQSKDEFSLHIYEYPAGVKKNIYDQFDDQFSQRSRLRMLKNNFTLTINDKTLITAYDKDLTLDYVKAINFIGSDTFPNLSITGNFLRKGVLLVDTIAYPNQNATYPFGKTDGQASFLYFTIVIKGDDNNGITFTIPRWVMENYYSPFYLDVTDIIASGYSAKANGRVYNYQIEIRDVVTTGWSKIFINVFGIY